MPSSNTSDMSDPRILEICSKSKALPLDDLSGAVSTHDQNSSGYFYHIFVETRDGWQGLYSV